MGRFRGREIRSERENLKHSCNVISKIILIVIHSCIKFLQLAMIVFQKMCTIFERTLLSCVMILGTMKQKSIDLRISLIDTDY